MSICPDYTKPNPVLKRMVQHAEEMYKKYARPKTWQDILREAKQNKKPEKYMTLEEALRKLKKS